MYLDVLLPSDVIHFSRYYCTLLLLYFLRYLHVLCPSDPSNRVKFAWFEVLEFAQRTP